MELCDILSKIEYSTNTLVVEVYDDSDELELDNIKSKIPYNFDFEIKKKKIILNVKILTVMYIFI